MHRLQGGTVRDVDKALEDTGSEGLAEYGARLRRGWWALALGLVLGLIGGYVFTATRTPLYTSTTTVLVLPVGTTAAAETGRVDPEINLETESQLIRSVRVADIARGSLKAEESSPALLERLTVTVPPNTQVLSITFVDSSPGGAQAGARAFARAYLTNRTSAARTEIKLAQGQVDAQLKAAGQARDAAIKRSAGLPANTTEKIAADSDRIVAQNQITALTTRLNFLKAMTVTPGQVISDAPLPTRASYPVPVLNIGAGLAAGLLLGLALAVVVDRTDHKVRRAADVRRRLGLRVLADLTVRGRRRQRNQAPGLSVDPVRQAAIDRFRNAVAPRGTESSIVQVCDVGGRGASSAVALRLGESMARAAGGATVVLAHGESLGAELVDLSSRRGLVDLLRGDAALNDVCYVVPELMGVWVIPPGQDPHDVETLLQSPETQRTLESLRTLTPRTVIETLGPADSAAAQAVAAQCDTVVLVVERGADDRALDDSIQAAAEMGAAVVGAVLVPRADRHPGAAARARAASSAASVQAGSSPARPVHLADAGDDGREPRGSGAHGDTAGTPGPNGTAADNGSHDGARPNGRANGADAARPANGSAGSAGSRPNGARKPREEPIGGSGRRRGTSDGTTRRT